MDAQIIILNKEGLNYYVAVFGTFVQNYFLLKIFKATSVKKIFLKWSLNTLI